LNRKGYAFLLVLVTLTLVVSAKQANAVITYTVTAQPSLVNIGEQPIITVTITGGAASTSYSMQITVTKPGGASVGQSTITLLLLTDSTGQGSAAVTYPSVTPAWTTVSGGPANTDVKGLYSITVDKTAPNPAQTGVATGTFQVTSSLSINIVSPSNSLAFFRGDIATISACVSYVDSTPVISATVTSTTPSSSISLSAGSNPCLYTKSYQVQLSDNVGPWSLNVSATSGSNSGSSTIVVNVTPAQLVVTDLATYNSNGNPTADFNPGDTLYATFRIRYSPGGNFLTTGTYNVEVRNPSGATVFTLSTIYDQNRGLFYTPSGFALSAQDPSGAWQLAFSANSIADAYQNTGPPTVVSQRFQVHANAFVVSQFYYILGAIGLSGGLSTMVFLRKFNTKKVPFDNLFKLTGGELRAPASLLIIGDPGAGSSTLGLQLLYRDLVAGKYCGLLSYDGFPAEVKRKMRDMGWDVAQYVEKGQLTILDCYSALAGVEGAQIRDPTDFTEVSIQVTGMIEKAKGPVTILLDSATPIFNSASAKDCINFLQVIGAKVKNSGGMFLVTATRGSIPDEAKSKIESLTDGVIELTLTKRARSLSRFLLVKKLSGRATSSTETQFEIVAGKGIMLDKRRVPIGLFQPK
jgi:KaiC/GvpD/RAD55 family RecA-like ATPase